MRLTVLGSGSTVPHPLRTSSGYWLETSGGSLLLDCSASVPMRLAQEKLHWPQLDAVWISHFHLDHCGGLGPLLAGIKHAAVMQDRRKTLKIFGPAGTRDLIQDFDAVNNYRLLEQPFKVEVHEVEELTEFEIVPGAKATTMSTLHTSESHAIRVTDVDGTSMVFTSDTGFDERISTFAKKVDLLLMECAFVAGKTTSKHLELVAAAFLARKAAPKRTLLTHFYPGWDEVDFEAEIAKLKPYCQILEARDGLRLDI